MLAPGPQVCSAIPTFSGVSAEHFLSHEPKH